MILGNTFRKFFLGISPGASGKFLLKNILADPGGIPKKLLEKKSEKLLQQTPEGLPEEPMGSSHRILREIPKEPLEGYSGNCWKNSRGSPGGIPEQLLEKFPRNSWINSWGTSTAIREELLEGYSANSWKNYQGTPIGISEQLLEEFPRNPWNNW